MEFGSATNGGLFAFKSATLVISSGYLPDFLRITSMYLSEYLIGYLVPVGSRQQSPLPAGSVLPASRTTFQFPSACLRQIVMYRPDVVTGLPLASLLRPS